MGALLGAAGDVLTQHILITLVCGSKTGLYEPQVPEIAGESGAGKVTNDRDEEAEGTLSVC